VLEKLSQYGQAYAGEAYSLLCALAFALGVVLFRRSGRKVPPVALNFFKNTVALVALLPTMLIAGSPLRPAAVNWDGWLLLLGSGIIGIGIADSVFFASLNRLGAGRSAIVDCLYSPIVVLCAALALAEPVGPGLLGGLALMVIAILWGAFKQHGEAKSLDKATLHRGVALGALAMLLMAIGIVMAKPVLDGVDVLWATTVRLVGGTGFLAVQSCLPQHRASVRFAFQPSKLWLTTIPAGLIGSYLAMMLWLAGMKYTQASIASVLNQTSTLIVPLLAAPMLGERLTRRRLEAVLLGFAGAVVVTLWGRG